MNRAPEKGTWYLAALLVGGVAVAFAYWREWVALEQIWRTRDEWSYGYLVLPLAGAITWARLRRFPRIPVRPSPWAGALVVGLGLALRYAALWAGVISISWGSMVIVIAGLAIGVLGIRFLRVLYVPLLYLFLLFPWPTDVYERVALPMQRAAAVGSLFILDLVGILARREGNVIHLYGGSLEVAQACSGLRLLLAFVSVAGAVAFIVDRPRWQRLVILASSLPVALIANMARVVTTAMAAEWFGMEAASGWFHGTAGYAMILLAFALFWFELWFLGKVVIPDEGRSGGGAEAAAPLWRPQSGTRPVLVAILLGLPLVATGFLQPAIERGLDRSAALQPYVPLQQPLAEFPDRLAGYAARDLPLEREVAKALKADDSFRKVLVDGDGREVATIFASYNGVARKFYTHRPTVCMPSAGWVQLSEERREMVSATGREIPYSAMVFSHRGRRLVIVAYFNASGALLTRIESLRLHMARPGRGYVSQVMVSVRVPPGSSVGEAEEEARGLLAALTDEMENFLPDTGATGVEGDPDHETR